MYEFIKDILKCGLSLWQQRFSAEEKEILIEAAETGEVWKLYADAFGHWVRAGRNRDFCKPDDPAYMATYLEALDRLIGRGLVVHEGEILYRLTGSGHKAAERLAKKRIAIQT